LIPDEYDIYRPLPIPVLLEMFSQCGKKEERTNYSFARSICLARLRLPVCPFDITVTISSTSRVPRAPARRSAFLFREQITVSCRKITINNSLRLRWRGKEASFARGRLN
jgi:hypothetical protein